MNNYQVCVDASFTIKVAVPEDGSEVVAELMQGWRRDGIEVLAPTLLLYEATSAIRKRTHRGDLASDEGREALEVLLGLPIVQVSSADLHRAALRLSEQLNQTAAYDAHYAALALELQCPFWTADSRLYDSLKNTHPDAHLVS